MLAGRRRTLDPRAGASGYAASHAARSLTRTRNIVYGSARHAPVFSSRLPRPTSADSLPVVGPSPKLANVYLGYGHQHVGLTGGPKTGRWLAQMITGAAVNEDLSAYAPDRGTR